MVQLRQDNALGTLYNMVGFQTKLKYGEQTRRSSACIPGLEQAEFARLGGLHRNTFINSRPSCSTASCGSRPSRACASPARSPASRAMSNPQPSACWRAASRPRSGCGKSLAEPPPVTTAHGALLNHITGGAEAATFQPMNVNFGLFPPLGPGPNGKRLKKRERKPAMSARALADLTSWIESSRSVAA